MPLSPSSGNNHNHNNINNSIFKSLSPALQKRLELRRQLLDDQPPAGEVMDDEGRDEPGAGGVKSTMHFFKTTAPPQPLYHPVVSSRMNGWEDQGEDTEEEKKQDDHNINKLEPIIYTIPNKRSHPINY